MPLPKQERAARLSLPPAPTPAAGADTEAHLPRKSVLTFKTLAGINRLQ